MKNAIQVAGVHDHSEAALLAECGADYIGIPLRLPVNKEDLSEEEAAKIAARSKIPCVLITYLEYPDEIIAFCSKIGVNHVQLHGPVSKSNLADLRRKAPELYIIKSLVIGESQPEELHRIIENSAPLVDAFITDTYDPETGASGATGKTHDWQLSREIISLSPKPVILAGGLNPQNVAEAIITVRPAAVDVHTGVEGTDGRKTREKMLQFVQNAKEGFARLK